MTLVGRILPVESMSVLSFSCFVLSGRYHIPLSLKAHIDYITPGVKIQEVSAGSHKRRQKRTDVDIFPQPILGSDVDLGELLKDVLSYCDVVVSPACIQRMYTASYKWH